MAFNILNPTGNLSNQTTPSSVIPLSYHLNTGSKWIYCNYPEAIPGDAFGDTDCGNACLNQVTVPAGEHQIFYSYYDKNGLGPYYFAVQIYNPYGSNLIYQTINSGHRDSSSSGGWNQCIGGVWEDYFNSSSETPVTIASGRVHWCQNRTIPRNSIFTGNIRFSVSDAAIVTVYIYKGMDQIDGTATPYPKDPAGIYQYSGAGNGFFFTSERITLNASSLSAGKHFKMAYPNNMSSLTINSTAKTTDLIPIKLACDGTTVSSPTGNLGNWCAQYYYPINLVNDTSTTKTFSAYVKTDVGGDVDNWMIIKSGSQCKYATLNPSVNNSWKWLSQTVAPGATVSGDFQFILGTNSCGKASMIFRAN